MRCPASPQLLLGGTGLYIQVLRGKFATGFRSPRLVIGPFALAVVAAIPLSIGVRMKFFGRAMMLRIFAI